MASANEEVRIIVFGTIKSGKSSIANCILRSAKFETKVSGYGKTKVNQRSEVALNNKTVVVVDTPGFFNFQDAIHTGIIKEQLSKALDLAGPGPHAIILVISVIGFSKTELDIIDWITDERKDMLQYIYVVFTGRDILEKENNTFDNFKSEFPKPLQKFLDGRMEGRVFCFGNTKNEQGVINLLQAIDKRVKAAYHPFYKKSEDKEETEIDIDDYE